MTNTPEHQPPPLEGHEKVIDHVIEDLQSRAKEGHAKYGTYLMSYNGRDSLVDLYEELLDAVMYVRQRILEKRGGKTIRIEGCNCRNTPLKFESGKFICMGCGIEHKFI
jgi:hypothetical protein